jgi:hypothetical protein
MLDGYTRPRLFQYFFMPTPPVSASFVRRGRQIYGSLRDSTLLIKSDDHQVDPDTVSANERVSLSRYGPISGCAHVRNGQSLPGRH